MTSILIGCPVRARGWILPTWREYTLKACAAAGLEPKFLFVVGSDEASQVDWPDAELIIIDEEPRSDDHDWSKARYHHMVEIRNILLTRVREIAPDYFLSLDSDILLREDALVSILQVFSMHPEAWAVGGKADMGQGTHVPSYGFWNNKAAHGHGMNRHPSNEVCRVDVILGCKLMKEKAYSTDYKYHHWGEDLGWASNIAQAGGKLWWDGRVTNKHVMKKKMLEQIDVRCGY